MASILKLLPELQGQELAYVQDIIKNMADDEAQLFANIYRTRRRDPQLILITTLQPSYNSSLSP
jgi:hypothetical protein